MQGQRIVPLLPPSKQACGSDEEDDINGALSTIFTILAAPCACPIEKEKKVTVVALLLRAAKEVKTNVPIDDSNSGVFTAQYYFPSVLVDPANLIPHFF